MPEERHKVYVAGAGIVTEVLVDHGSRVQKGDVAGQARQPRAPEGAQGADGRAGEGRAPVRLAPQQCRAAQAAARDSDDSGAASRSRRSSPRRRITAQSAKERIEIVEEQIESMNVRSPQDGIITTWEAKKTLMGRPVEIGTELLQIAATDGEWVLEVEVPDDDMGPVLAAKSKLEDGHQGGAEKRRRDPAGLLRDHDRPEHRYPGYVRRIAPSAEDVAESEQYKNRHIVKVTVGFSEAVRQDYMKRNKIKEMRPGCRSPGEDRLRPDQPGLLLAPQADPGLLRVGPVPLAVPAAERCDATVRRPSHSPGGS